MANLKNIISTENRTIIIRPLDRKKSLPIIIKKDSKIFKTENKAILKTLLLSDTYCKEDILYESQPGDFVQGTSQHKITLVNKLNITTNGSCTYANYKNDSGQLVSQKSSENIIKLIGQKNYDTVLSALCSVINQELKVRGILALLTANDTKFVDSSCQTDKHNDKDIKEGTTTEVLDIEFKPQRKKRLKRTTLTPYVIKDDFTTAPKIKKVTIDPFNTSERQIIEDLDNGIKFEITEKTNSEKQTLPDIKHFFNEESSNEGSIGNLSSLSVSMDHVLENPNVLLKKVDEFTEESNKGSTIIQPLTDNATSNFNNSNQAYIPMLDGTKIMVSIKPEDHFHIATPDILKSVTKEDRIRLIGYQAYIDYKFCLERDEDGNLPIHNAVLNNDVYMLRRQCLVLKNRQTSIDITSCNMTALQMSLFSPTALCTSMLLRYGADPLHTDDEQRTVLHLAAENAGPHLAAILSYCQNNAMQILQEHEELWCPSLEGKTTADMMDYLLSHMCKMVDSQGYTALMSASKAGAAVNVRLLVEAAPATLDTAMPNCGNTALYLAVGAACLDAMERRNKSKLAENFLQTIKILIMSGANPTICNHSGQNVHDLLTEFNIPELTSLIATAIASNNGVREYNTRMLVKEQDGSLSVENITSVKSKNVTTNADKKNGDKQSLNKDKINLNKKDKPIILDKKDKPIISDKKDKPIILENISLSPSVSNAARKKISGKNMKITSAKKLDIMTGGKVIKEVPFKLLRKKSLDGNNVVDNEKKKVFVNKITNFETTIIQNAQQKKCTKPKYWTIRPYFMKPEDVSAGTSTVTHNNTSISEISPIDVEVEASDVKKQDQEKEGHVSAGDKIANTESTTNISDDNNSINVTEVKNAGNIKILDFVSDGIKAVPCKRKSTTAKPRTKKAKNIKDP